jgi:phage terminase large subunit-like protein
MKATSVAALLSLTASELVRYRTDPAAFIDRFIPFNEKGQPWRLSVHQRRVLKLALRFTEDGRLDCLRALLWGEMKKSGKTALAAALGLWWAYTRPQTEVIVVANDLEQSVGRVFQTMVKLIRNNPALSSSATIRATYAQISNGTVITAIASDYRGAAGSRHSLVIVDEPWGIVSENAQRLMEELTPPPTEPEAWVLLVSYAGFVGESLLLERFYQRGLAGERLDDDLEVYRSDDLVMFWSHTPRQPWQTAEYYAEQRRSLRPNAYLRMHENRWVQGTEQFITAELWDGNVDPDHRPFVDRAPSGVYIGLDAAVKHDNAAGVAVRKAGQRLELVAHKIWKPTPSEPLDIENTIEAWVREMCARHRVEAVLCDPYQLHRSITTLRARGVRIREYPQTSPNLTAMGELFFELLRGRNLRLYPDVELRQQALNTVAIESTRGWRIAKEKSAKKIDAIIASAMSCKAALDGESGGTVKMVKLFGHAYGGSGYEFNGDIDPATGLPREGSRLSQQGMRR